MLLLLIALTLTGATTLIAQPTSSPSQGHVEEALTLEAGGSLIEGYVDWTKNELVVYGDATVPEHISNPVQRRLLGFRGAKAVAYRNLLEMIGEVQIDSETRVQNFILTSDSISVKVQGLVRGARIIAGSQIENEGLYRIALRLPLLGDFADAVLPEVARLAPDAYDIILPAPPEPMADSLASSEDIIEEEAVVFIPRVPYTGILVDARGLDLQPSMSPRILSEEGRIIYGAATVDHDYATQYGIIGYDKDIDRALKSDRLGGEKANPFVVKATRTSGLYSGDAVLSEFDATRVLMADSDSDFLHECRVTFVLGAKPVSFESMFTDSTNTDTTLISEGEEFEFQGETAPGDEPQ